MSCDNAMTGKRNALSRFRHVTVTVLQQSLSSISTRARVPGAADLFRNHRGLTT
jgi:hypothetical protein